MNTKEKTQIVIPEKDKGDFALYAPMVSQWTYAEPGMSARSVEKVLSYFNEGRSVLLFDTTTYALLAHAAIKWISPESPLLEIGSVIVNPTERGKGYGSIAVSAVWALAKKKYPDYVKFAFCNVSSLQIFKLLGAVEAQADQLPQEVWQGTHVDIDTLVILPNSDPKKYDIG